jgi:hypothetical protein
VRGVAYEWRGSVANDELNALHAQAFGHPPTADDWRTRDARGNGIGTALVRCAAGGARTAGCEWLHVDFDVELRSFYFDACGFTPTDPGLIAL